MIQIPKAQLTQVEYLIEQSLQGHHVLFRTSELRRVFRSRGAPSNALSEEEAYAMEPVIERLIGEPSIEGKRAFLDGLDQRTFDAVVRTYFSIVENNLFERIEARH